MDEMYGLHSSSSTGGGADDHYSDNRGLMMLSDSDNLIMNPAALDNYNTNYHEYHHHHPMIPAVVFGSAEGLGFQCSESVAQNLLYEDHEHAASTTHHHLIKSKIASHPAYPKLIDAYIDCQKVGAPPEIAGVLDEIRREKELMIKYHDESVLPMCLGLDPELDEFMETYYDMLVQYKSDLSRPFDEATSFLNKIQTQLGNLSKGDGSLSSDEEVSGGETETHDTQTKSEDRELKERLFRKYGSHISSLKQEFSKKKKKGKLPKEARQVLLEWWNVHCKWPYPTEADKFSLAESAGLDQKQINNWFINQRKRHWKPSENMQMAIMDNLSGHFFGED